MISDIAALSKLARRHGALVCCDNTCDARVARPLALGADLVMHSSPKFFGGHSDVLGGAVIVRDKALFERLYHYQATSGAVPAPFDCWLVRRSIAKGPDTLTPESLLRLSVGLEHPDDLVADLRDAL